MYQFTAKRPNEQEIFGFDFTAQLATGEIINPTPTVTATVLSGNDPSPQNIVSGTATIKAGKVSQLIVGGVDGETYQLVCQIVTSLGQRLEAVGSLKISDSVV